MMRTILASTAALLVASGTAFAVDWDPNYWEDDFIDETEFREGVEGVDLYNTLDANADEVIDEQEFAIIVPGGAAVEYTQYDADADAGLNEDEFYSGVFDLYDADDDDKWTKTEAHEFDTSAIQAGTEVSQ